MKSIAVIGAGITGVTTASSLTDRGYDVTLFDLIRYAAMQTSLPTADSCQPPMPRRGTAGRPSSRG
ncbi:FAD-dependent oxidoreductase [Mesobacterium pallidum]|uniref:FAD-dependent oxidoreductase n=1 Tax=Mesobacterium pallidum TaxID=2872037 RepID=UPI003AB933BD